MKYTLALLAVWAGLGCDDADDNGGADAARPVDATHDQATEDLGVPGLPSPEVLAERLDLTAYGTDLEFIARERTPGSAHWQAVQDRCAEVFAASGFTVERHDYGSGVNVIGVRPGTTAPDEWVVLSGHYDHIEACAGADDNATGAAGVLAAARALANQTFERTLILACWDEEEWGLVGARAWTQRAKRQNANIKASYVLETIGTFSDEPNTQFLPLGFEQLFPEAGRFVAERDFRGDFIAAIADDLEPSAVADFIAGAARFEVPVAEVVLNEAFRSDPSLGDLRRSDHAEFWAQGWPGMMITSTANFRNPNYHCTLGPDDIALVDVDRAFRTVQAATFATARQARPAAAGEGAPLDTTTDPMPPVALCDLYTQDCPADQKCVVTQEGGRCVPNGVAAQGEMCARGPGGFGDDTCAAGTVCAGHGQPLSDPQTRTCHAYCQAHADCDQGEVCQEVFRRDHVGICVGVCDPLDPDACGPGQACYYANSARPGETTAVCFPGTLTYAARGEACSAMTACEPGLFCVPAIAGRPAQCQPWCADTADCGPGFICLPTGVPDRGRCLPE